MSEDEPHGLRIASSRIAALQVEGEPLTGTPYVLLQSLGKGGMGESTSPAIASSGATPR